MLEMLKLLTKEPGTYLMREMPSRRHHGWEGTPYLGIYEKVVQISWSAWSRASKSNETQNHVKKLFTPLQYPLATLSDL